MTDGSSNADSAPKIVIDSDWKSQAQAEKERLAAAERSKAPMSRSAGDPAVPQEGDGEGLPEANFKALIGTLITNALMYLGAFPDPQSGRAMVAPEYAKFHIDLLGVLQEKTKGNLTEEEQQDIDHSIRELRMQFVEVMRAVTAMAMKSEAQRQAGGVSGGAGGGGAVDVAKVGAQLRGQ
ncbi:MAG: DUF1844 domain-containing protein [Phycisphaeraceae bacterium]|nr:DUF1844 domain-containing protein [Phycisphaeraceae bacterium]